MRQSRSRSSIFADLRKAGLPAAALILMGFFGYYAVLGPNGILSYRQYVRELEVRRAEFAQLDRQREELRNRVNLMDPRKADPDMVDEMVRKQLNVAHPDEVILPIQP